MSVVLNHAVRLESQTGLSIGFGLKMSEDVHASRIKITEERFTCLVLAVHEIERCGQEFFVNRFHPLFGQWTGILNLAVSVGMNDPTRPKTLLEFGIFWVVGILRLFFGIEVVEVTKELVKTMVTGEKLVFVAQMIFAKLTC